MEIIGTIKGYNGTANTTFDLDVLSICTLTTINSTAITSYTYDISEGTTDTIPCILVKASFKDSIKQLKSLQTLILIIQGQGPTRSHFFSNLAMDQSASLPHLFQSFTFS